jgi:hypothetical protein
MAVKPSGKSTVGRGRPENEDEPTAPPADDDPFAIDPSIAAGAIPVSRQPGPGKPLEVICPMCETKGFVSLKAAGKQVKCCNPQCMVPIFAAPAPEKKEVAPPPPPKKKIPWMYVGGGIATVAIAGCCFWFMQDEGVKDIPPDPTKMYVPRSDANEALATDHKNTGSPDEGKANNADKIEGPQDDVKVRQEIIKQALQRLLEVSQRIEKQRRPQWRRMAITAYLFAGETKDADLQLGLLKKDAPSEGVLPVVARAWRSAAKPDEFKRAVDEARGLADQLPPRGRYASEAAVAFAPLLVVSGKPDEAHQILVKHRTEPLVEQLAAALRVVVEDASYNLDATLIGRTVGDWQRPMETAVTLILAAHGRWDDALAWSTQDEDPVTKTEGTIAWAESYVLHAVPADDAAGWQRAAGAGKDLPVEGKARLLARLAFVRLSKGDRPGAAELISQADQALKTLPEPKSIRIKTIKEVYDIKIDTHAAVPLRQAALAATDIACVHAKLGDAKTAWSNVSLALQFMRAIGPSWSAMQERRAQFDGNQGAVQASLARDLGLKKDDDKRNAVKRYKERLKDAEDAAFTRFHGQAIILKAAANFEPLEQVRLDQIWEELQANERRKIEDREPLLASALPLLVAAKYEEAGDRSKKDEILELVQPKLDANNPDVIEQTVEQLLKTGDLTGSLEQLNAAMNPHGTLHEFALRVACRLVNQGKSAEAVSFCSRIKDQAIREDGLFLTAALAARTGKGENYWKPASGLGLMETSAVCCGLIIGFNSAMPAAK